MVLGRPGRPKAPLGVLAMLVALVVAAFIGAAAGLIWQSTDWFAAEPADEVVIAEGADA